MEPIPGSTRGSLRPVLFSNGLLVPDAEGNDLIPADLLVDEESGKIVKIIYNDEKLNNDFVSPPDDHAVRVIDCSRKIISPGFIDSQINGAYGYDFSTPDITREQVEFIAERLLETGVTSFLPTLISCSAEEYAKILPVIGPMTQRCRQKGDYVRKTAGAHILGLHLEGPFFAPNKAGAHPRANILDPVDGFDTLRKVYGTSRLGNAFGVTTITMAPERIGALKAIDELTNRDVIVAMGHTEATLEDGRKGMSNGASLLTHIFNAMKPFHHREPGLVGLLAEDHDKRPFYSLISDGIHVHETAVRMAHCLHPAGAVIITDAMSALGLGDGFHTLGETEVSVQGMKATVACSETLAGSVASMDHCVRLYKQFTKCSNIEALRAATLHPAQVLGENRKGRLVPGADADLVILDDDLNVLSTWIGGEKLFDSKYM